MPGRQMIPNNGASPKSDNKNNLSDNDNILAFEYDKQ